MSEERQAHRVLVVVMARADVADPGGSAEVDLAVLGGGGLTGAAAFTEPVRTDVGVAARGTAGCRRHRGAVRRRAARFRGRTAGGGHRLGEIVAARFAVARVRGQ